uniref:Asl1-like glycosyl hydrolase catalytic domain-containing protein n=1 Tax=Alexandrium monilatum TaxID=311494 RepID=A0A7S4SM52_9DINO
MTGVSPDGTATGGVQTLINGLKASSSFGKVSYWNWDFAPKVDNGHPQYLTRDFLFMPENWGVGADKVASQLRPAGAAGFLDGDGRKSPAEMGTVLLGANEPDMYGSCMGNMMGRCTAPCTDAEAPHCPAARLDGSGGTPLPNGHCNCWQYSHATGVGFWPFKGCSKLQPLPTLWDDNEPGCVSAVMAAWKATAQAAVQKGYKYLSTPLIAVNLDYARKFIEHACGCSGGHCACQDASCGCPVYVGFHFYGYDCQPEQGDYAGFQKKLDAVARIMEDYPFVKGAIINEVGMLNCARSADKCVPDSGKYPAARDPHGGCPATPSLPNGLGTFMEQVVHMAAASRTRDGRAVVKSFSWFNLNRDGATYDLRLLDDKGSLSPLGQAYIAACSKWAPQRENYTAVLV